MKISTLVKKYRDDDFLSLDKVIIHHAALSESQLKESLNKLIKYNNGLWQSDRQKNFLLIEALRLAKEKQDNSMYQEAKRYAVGLHLTYRTAIALLGDDTLQFFVLDEAGVLAAAYPKCKRINPFASLLETFAPGLLSTVDKHALTIFIDSEADRERAKIAANKIAEEVGNAPIREEHTAIKIFYSEGEKTFSDKEIIPNVYLKEFRRK